MGKVTKFTGSRLLGAELRRLRGGRSLKQISELSKTPPLSERVSPVAAPTLSQIENGISFPSLETIHSLAHVYKRPVQQLLDLIVQERLIGEHAAGGSPGSAKERYLQFVRDSNWHGALAVAAQAENATEGSESVKWRGNRALALFQLGLVEDSIALLQACLDHPDLPESQEFSVHQVLASFLESAGLHRSAALHQKAAVAGAPEDLSDAARRHLLRSNAYCLLRSNQERETPDERAVRSALHQLDEALALAAGTEPEFAGLIRVHRALAHELLGNATVAIRDLDVIVAEAREEVHQQVLMEAQSVLGLVRRRQGRMAAAVRAFEECAQIAADLRIWEMAFDRCFDVHALLCDSDEARASVFLRRCERYYPLLTGRTPNLIRFEAVERGY